MPRKEELQAIGKKTEEHEFYSGVPKGYKPGKTKFIIVTGSVMSGVGKGTFTSTLGCLLRLFHGLNVSPVKFDGYLNYDAGTLNPYRHGEVFVLRDGTECDLDLGSYERLLNVNLVRDNYLTGGKIFKNIIDKERGGHYLGRDVQFIPHVTGEIKEFLRTLGMRTKADIVLVEVGGTVGDIENSYFLEAMRELAHEEGKHNVCFVNVTYIMQPSSLGEQKSKAAQLGVRSLMGLGIQPHIVVCRSERPVSDKIKEKVSIFSNVPTNRVVSMHDAENIYHIPVYLKEIGLDRELFQILRIIPRAGGAEAKRWLELVKKIGSSQKTVNIAMTGKYTEVHDSYFSILKALEHSAPYVGAKVNVKWIETTSLKSLGDVKDALVGMDGVIVPGGFGARGTEGKILCVQYCRENNIPYLGLCYGMQLATIEFARNVAGLAGANSTEIDQKTQHPVVDLLPEQLQKKEFGATMRLGIFEAELKKGTKVHRLYGKERIEERHRHRFEVNPKYVDALERKGIVFSGFSARGHLAEFIEIPSHKFFVGTQAHPEFNSKPLEPHPLYLGFVEACLKK